MYECGLRNTECGIKRPGVSRKLQKPNLLPVPQIGFYNIFDRVVLNLSGYFHKKPEKLM